MKSLSINHLMRVGLALSASLIMPCFAEAQSTPTGAALPLDERVEDLPG